MFKKISMICLIFTLLFIAGCSQNQPVKNEKAKDHAVKKTTVKKVSEENSKKAAELIKEADKMKWEKKFDEAFEKYEEAVKIDPSNPNGYIGKAFIYRVKDQPEKALKTYDEGIGVLPGDVDLWAVKAKVLFLGKRFDEAAEAYKKVRELDEKDYIINRYLADCYVRMNKPEEADKIYNEALQKFPGNSELCEYYAAFCFNRADTMKEKSEALTEFQKSADLYGNSFKNLGEDDIRMRPRIMFRWAEAYFNKWQISKDPQDKEASIKLFIAYKKLDRNHIYAFSADRMIVEMEEGGKKKTKKNYEKKID